MRGGCAYHFVEVLIWSADFPIAQECAHQSCAQVDVLFVFCVCMCSRISYVGCWVHSIGHDVLYALLLYIIKCSVVCSRMQCLDTYTRAHKTDRPGFTCQAQHASISRKASAVLLVCPASQSPCDARNRTVLASARGACLKSHWNNANARSPALAGRAQEAHWELIMQGSRCVWALRAGSAALCAYAVLVQKLQVLG